MKRITTQNLLITIMGRIIAFFLAMVIAKELSVESYAVYLQAGLLLSFAPYFQFGTMNGFPYFASSILITRGEKELEEMFSMYSLLTMMLMIPFIIFLAIYNTTLENDFLIIIVLIGVMQKLSENFLLFLNSLTRFEEANFLKATNEIAVPLMQILSFYIFRNVKMVFISMFISLVICNFIQLFFVKFNYGCIRFNQLKSLKKLFALGFPVYVVWLLDFSIRNLDKIFISKFYPAEIFSIYGFTSGIASIPWLLALSYMSPFVTILINKINENNQSEVKLYLNKRKKELTMITVSLVFLSMLGYPILTKFIVKKYTDGYQVFLILLINSAFLILNNYNIYFLTAKGEIKKILKYSIWITFINIIANFMIVKNNLDMKYLVIGSTLNLIIYYLALTREVDKKLIQREVGVL